jgi:integrase
MTARAFTAHEITQLADHFAARGCTRDRLMVVLGATTGLRAQELLGATVGDLWDPAKAEVARALYIQRARLKGGRSAKKRAVQGRRIPLADPVREVARQHLLSIGVFVPSLAVFASRESQGRPMTVVQAYRRLRQGCAACGIDLCGVSLHSLRRHFAQSCYDLTHSILTVQRCLGHASALSTMIYLASDQAEADATIGELGSRLGGQLAGPADLAAPAGRAPVLGMPVMPAMAAMTTA